VLIASGAAFAQQSPTPPESSPPGSSPPASTPSEKQPVEASHGGLVLGDAKAGEGKAAACGACHGMDGNSSDKQYPKLAGQNEAYIARQIKLFQSQKRQNAIMMGFAATLSEQDMHDVGAYFASKSSLAGVADEKLLERGQALYRGGDGALGVPACMACHGPDGRGMAGAGYPQLAGQWADYVQAKLKDWKSGTTWGDDANAKIMPEIARRLGDTDIAALASYVEGLHTATGAATASTAAP
jgi:cbb3-type cytochrome c oxidase subunit III